MPKQLKEISVSHLCPNCGKGLLPNKFRKGFVWCPNYKTCGLKTRRAYVAAAKAGVGEIAPLTCPSDEQQAIFDAVTHTDTHLLIEALAGTGKTTVMVQLVRIFAEQNYSVLALSFSRRDKEALMGKCFDKAKIMTSNGAGMGILSTAARANKKTLQISDDLAFRTLRQRWIDDGLIVKGGNGEGKDKWEMSAHVLNCVLTLVEKARGTLPMNVNGKKEPTEQDWQDLCERFNIDIKAEHWATVLFYCQVMFTQLCSLKFALNVGIDLTGQIFLPVYHNMKPTTQYDKVLVDEAQDQSYYTRMIAALYLKPQGKLIACGDKHQCQPAGTMVSLTGGEQKPIEAIVAGDAVVTYSQHSSAFVGRHVPGRKVTATAVRDYTGTLLTVTVGDKQTQCTPNHKWLVRFVDRTDVYNVVYLMRKGENFRIGWCQLFSNKAIHLGTRTRLEMADESWILSVHDNKTDASMNEKILSVRYGISMCPFKQVEGAQHYNQKTLNTIWEAIGNNRSQAKKCLEAHKRDIDYPFYVVDMKKRYRNTLMTVNACNLFPELMKVPTYTNGEREATWTPINVTSEFVESIKVYSLQVAGDENYIANGILTKNCVYVWRGKLYQSSPSNLPHT